MKESHFGANSHSRVRQTPASVLSSRLYHFKAYTQWSLAEIETSQTGTERWFFFFLFGIRQMATFCSQHHSLRSISYICVGEWSSSNVQPETANDAAVDQLPLSRVRRRLYSRRPAKRSSATCSACTAGAQAFGVGLIGHLEKFHMNSHQEFLPTKRQTEHLAKHLWCV